MSDETTHGGPTGLRRTRHEHAPAEAAGNTSEPTEADSGDGRGSAAGRRAQASPAARVARRPQPPQAQDRSRAAEGAAAKDRRPRRGEDYTDAAADRGLTTDDVAADATEEAGLAEAEPGAVTARRRAVVGEAEDRRQPTGAAEPATVPADPAASRRRRGGRGRGGRGRGAGGRREDRTAEAVQRRSSAPMPAAVVARRARRRRARAAARPDPQGPAGRALHDGRARQPDDRTTHIAVLEGRSLVEHYVGSLEPDDTADRRQHLPRPGAERAARDGGGVHRHRHAEERRALPRRRRLRPERRRGEPAPDRAAAQERPVGDGAGHQEPDRGTRAPGSPRR